MTLGEVRVRLEGAYYYILKSVSPALHIYSRLLNAQKKLHSVILHTRLADDGDPPSRKWP